MVEETAKLRILECCKKLSEHKLTAKGDVCSVRMDEGIMISDPEIDMADITEKDIRFVGKNDAQNALEALHLAIYAHREDINAIVMNHAPFCVGIAKKLNAVPATLDDMAQIIGHTAKVSPSDEVTDVLKTLTGRNGRCRYCCAPPGKLGLDRICLPLRLECGERQQKMLLCGGSLNSIGE